MEEQAAAALYGLALALVPDENVAGDLLLAARDEADLRRRAERWRRQNGLPPPPDAVAPVALDAEQHSYALHIARRGARQRRRRPWLLAVALALLLTAGAVARFTLLSPPVGLAADSAFAAIPVATSNLVGGMELQVYRAEATPGTVTVWWALHGAGSSRLMGDAALRLFAQGLTQLASGQEPRIANQDRLWRAPLRQDIATPRRDRLIGRSVFRAASLDWGTALLELNSQRDASRQWSVRIPLRAALPDPAAHTLAVNQTTTAGNFTVTLESVTLAPDYTAVRYSGVMLPAGAGGRGVFSFGRGPFRQIAAAEVEDGQRLATIGLWRPSQAGAESVEAVFEPLPGAARTLTVSFPALGQSLAAVSYPLPAPQVVSEWHREGMQVTATLQLPDAEGLPGIAYLVDGSGDSYSVRLFAGAQPGSYRLTTQSVPADKELVSLLVGFLRRTQAPSFAINLAP